MNLLRAEFRKITHRKLVPIMILLLVVFVGLAAFFLVVFPQISPEAAEQIPRIEKPLVYVLGAQQAATAHLGTLAFRIRIERAREALAAGETKQASEILRALRAETTVLGQMPLYLELLELEIDGQEQLALTKAVQVDPIRRVIEHIDFVAVRRGEKVTVDVPVHLEGEAGPETLVVTENSTVQIEAEATAIPERIEISIEGLPAGTQILAGQLELPAGATLLLDPETLIVNVTEQVSEEALEAELEEAEAEAGIEREEHTEGDAESTEGGDAEAGEAAAEGDSSEE